MKILFSTGELSGENYAINLKRVIQKKLDNAEFIAIGSPRLESHDIRVIGDISPYATIGFTDIFKNFFSLYGLYNKLKKSIKTEKPDLIIFIDSPGLNLRLIPYAKRLKIKTAYLFPPQVWAWGKKRIETLKLANKIIVGFPFEEDFYRENRVNVKFLGHPLIDLIKVNEDYVTKLREQFASNRIIGVFPGSRIVEIRNHFPILGKTMEKISNKFSDVVYLIASPNPEFEYIIEEEVGEYSFPYEVITNHAYDIMKVSDFILTSSGTATLEAAILGVPEIIFYKMNFLNWFFAKFMVKSNFIGLPNLVYGKLIIPELVQWDFNSYSLEYLMIKFIVDQKVTARMVDKLARIKEMLGEEGAMERIGDELVSMLT